MSPSDSAGRPAARRPPWLWPVVAVAVLLLLAAVLWWWTRTHAGGATPAQRARLDAVLERGRSLSTQLAALKPDDAIDCPPGQQRRVVAPGVAPGGTSSATVPGLPTGAASAPATGQARALGEAALAERLELATAMVLVVDGDTLSTGTGFFIGANLLVTNRHVVEQKQRVLLASNALGSLRRATVLSTTSNSDPGTPDFALLRLDEGSAPGTLDTTPEVSKLASVVAAGFPGVVVQNDPRFRRLLKGDLSAAPDLSLTQGAVQSLQTGAAGMPLIVHTASIAKGNSGGPLVDGSGRLVGVDTFINVDQSQSSKISYAIRTEAMLAFLQSAGAPSHADGRHCASRG
jgi:S1-C subfamily serine protease